MAKNALTKKEKNNIYKGMLGRMELFKEGNRDPRKLESHYGFCILLTDLRHARNHNLGAVFIAKQLPELYKHKPKTQYGNGYWFVPGSIHGFSKRKKILETCIEQTS